ncbi:DUF1552 domain-containing protein [bacterium]|nr:DUF1552 domain-containing protein [bacterium]
MPSTLFQQSRRHFLRGASATIALPVLETFSADSTPADGPRNFVAVGTYLGWHQNAFFPKQTGKDYEISPTLSPLTRFRDDFTIFSGLDHRAPNGHQSWSNFLCGQAPRAWSLDQMIADELGEKSRFSSLQLTAGSGESGIGSKAISFTRQGIPLPMIQRPSVLYKKLFMSTADRARAEYVIGSGRSALDDLLEDAKRLQKSLPHSDSEKLEEYFDSVRAVEKRMGRQLEAINDPVPQPDYKLPSYDPVTPNLQIEAETILYDLMVLALQTDSTRVISLFLDGLGQVFSFDGNALGSGYHGLSHHGNDPAMIRELVSIETAHMHCFAGFMKQLKEKKNAQGRSLLDDTIIMLGTGMGDASRHSSRNLPTLLAGGGFAHQGHIGIDEKQSDSLLLGDLCITMMQKLGMEVDQFSNAQRNMNQLLS